MPPKAAGSKPKATKAAPPEHPTYKEMIKEAILALKDRNGSSRPALKKYIKANYKGVDTDRFDSLFNAALKKGEASKEFTYPKGPSGTVKLAKKEPAAKSTETKKPPTKKAAAPKKASAPKKAAAPKKPATAAAKKATPAKPKANAKKTRKEPAAAPAVVDKPAVLTKTKSGRVSKGTAAPKKAAPKKAAPKKKAAAKKSTT